MKCKLFLYIHFTWITQGRCAALASFSLLYGSKNILTLKKNLTDHICVFLLVHTGGIEPRVYKVLTHFPHKGGVTPLPPKKRHIGHWSTTNWKVSNLRKCHPPDSPIPTIAISFCLFCTTNMLVLSNFTEHSKTKCSLLIK